MSEKKEDKKEKKQSVLEKEIFSIMEKSMKTALDAAVDDLLKDWDKEIKIKLYRNAASRFRERSFPTVGISDWLAFFRFLPLSPYFGEIVFCR